MGARGNSGVITSQIFRGMAEGLGGKRRFNGLDLAHALVEGAETAYGAVAKPVEGTILTVIRESAAAAVAAAEHATTSRPSWRRPSTRPRSPSRGRRACSRSCARPASSTRAGRACTGCSRARCSTSSGRRPAAAAREPRRARRQAVDARRPRRRGVRLRDDVPAPGRRPTPLDVDAIRDHLETIGESVLVAGDARALKVHVHNERPDLVIGYGLTLGLAEPDQRREPRQPGARRPRDAGRGVHRPRRRRRTAARPRRRPVAGRRRRTARRRARRWPSSRSSPATASPAIFRDFGVAAVVQGGQTANPSTGELLEAVDGVDAREVLLLPNNPNVVLAARQVAAHGRPARGRRPDPQRRRGLRRAARARPDARRARRTSGR